jgi:hypothetical protein
MYTHIYVTAIYVEHSFWVRITNDKCALFDHNSDLLTH